MRLSHQKVRRLCAERGLSLSELLEKAGVSRTAFYSLTSRPSVVPESVTAVAAALHVDERDLLDPASMEETAVRARLRRAKKICGADPDLDFENVWHTLTLLEMSPRERLERSLRRGRSAAV